jgi:hypothetical protein
MTRAQLFSIMAAFLIFVSACSKDEEETAGGDPIPGGTTFTGINKVNVVSNGTTQEFVFADGINPTAEYAAFATKQTEDDFVYTEIILAATDHFEHISTAALIINYFGEGTGSHNISYGLADSSNLFNFSGSMFTLISDTATFPTMYFLEAATANITSYGDVGGYVEGTFESSEVSLAGVPQPNVTINGNFKVLRVDDGK